MSRVLTAGLALAALAAAAAPASAGPSVEGCQFVPLPGQTVGACVLVDPDVSAGPGGVLVGGWYHLAVCWFEPGQGCRQPPLQETGPTGVTVGEDGVTVWVAGEPVAGTR